MDSEGGNSGAGHSGPELRVGLRGRGGGRQVGRPGYMEAACGRLWGMQGLARWSPSHLLALLPAGCAVTS